MKAKIEHEQLDSNIATAAALLNEWIKYCVSKNISGRAMTNITQAFQTTGGEGDGSGVQEAQEGN